MKLSHTEAALEDLRSIRAYTLVTWGEKQEEIYLRKIWVRIEEIRENPSRYRLREELFPGCRIASEGRHVILFQVEANSLNIVRVLHSSMDFKREVKERLEDLRARKAYDSYLSGESQAKDFEETLADLERDHGV